MCNKVSFTVCNVTQIYFYTAYLIAICLCDVTLKFIGERIIITLRKRKSYAHVLGRTAGDILSHFNVLIIFYIQIFGYSNNTVASRPSFSVDHLITLSNNANVHYGTASIQARYPTSKMRHLSHGEKVLLMEKYNRNLLGRQRTRMSGTDSFFVSTGYLSRRQMIFVYANHMAYMKMCTFADRQALRLQYSLGGTMAPT